MMFGLFKKKVYDDYVDLTIGRVYIKPITHGIENKVRKKSTMIADIINNSIYFELMEYELVDLSKRKIRNLPIIDGDKVRAKVKEILVRHGLFNVEKPKEVEKVVSDKPDWSKADAEWFNRSKTNSLRKVGLNG